MDRSVVDVGSVAALAGLSVGVGALAVLHVLPTGLSPVHAAVSQYGITPYRLGYRVQTIAYAVAGIGVGAGLLAIPHAPIAAAVLCLVFAAARAAISWFPMDTPGTTPTVTGRRHGLLAIVAFVAVASAALRLPRHSAGDPLAAWATSVSTVVGTLMVVALVAMVVAGRASPGRRFFGAVERAFYLFATAWLVLVPVALLRLA